MNTIRLSGYKASPASLRFGTVDSYGVEQMQFVLGDDWKNLAITATFTNPQEKSTTVHVPTDTLLIDVPPEATAGESGAGQIAVVGYTDGVQVISTKIVYTLQEHAPIEGSTPAEPTPSLLQQVLTATGNAETSAAAAKDAAEQAKSSASAAAASAAAATSVVKPFADMAVNAAKEAVSAKDAAVTAAKNLNDSVAQIAANRTAVSQLKEDLGYARQNINQLSYLQNVGSQKHGYYEESANIWTPNNAITTIEVESNGKTPLYFTGKVLGSAHYGYAILWDAENNIISVIGRSTSTATQYELLEIIPTLQTKKITVSAYTHDGSKISLQKYAVRGIPKVTSENFVGHLETAEVNTEYVFIPCYGQSLSNGSDSLYVGDAVIDGNYTIGNIDDPSSGELTSLILSKNGEHPIVSAINSFSTLFRKYIGDAKFVCGSYGTGGQSIAQLMSAKRQAEIKAEENYNYNISSSGRYSVFEEAVNKVAEKCQSVSCPAIIFLQGERDYFSDESLSTQPGSVVAAYACGGDKEKYKSYMLRLKEDMQKKVMDSFNQKEKPLFCIYEVSGAFVKNTTMSIDMAQIEFANENDDVVLLPSPYFTPNYNSGHLSTNGYRWYGEYIAKTLFKTVCQHAQNTPMLPIGFRIDTDNSINIKVANVVNGLTIDTWTVEKASAYGFRVKLDDTETVLTGVSVYGDEIKIYCTDNPRNAKKVEISYAGMEKGGTGNIRDNDGYVSMYTYWDDTSDTGSSGKLTVTHRPTDINGNNIVGKKYPMQNWLQNFYYKIKG